MPTPQDIIATAGSLLQARHLKALGFRKSAHTWTRTSAERSEVINLQLSPSNTAIDARFTLNLGIHLPALHQALERLPVKGALKEYNCTIRSRIGRLYADERDQWWTVTETTHPEALTDLLQTETVNHALPWFGRLQTYADIASYFEAGNFLFIAAVAHHLGGQPDKARAPMSQAIHRNAVAKPRLTRISRALGISLETA